MLLHLSFLTLFACKGAEQICHKKLLDAQVIQDKSLSIPLKNNKRLLYSTRTPKEKILKHDPFLELYLIVDSSRFAYPYEIVNTLKLPLYHVGAHKASATEIVQKQLGLNFLARLNRENQLNAIITNSCCSLEAIVTERGVIEKEYIKRFLLSSVVEYGDIGVRLSSHEREATVVAVDPFFMNNPFKQGDKILALNGKKLTPAAFMREILFSRLGAKHSISLKRDGALLDVSVIVDKRHGGGALSDTLLESQGIFFDANLKIIAVSADAQALGLRKGDKLLQVNTKRVKTQEQVRSHISNFDEHVSLLFERENFEFFVNIK